MSEVQSDVDRECPTCGREAAAVVDVQSIGTETFETHAGQIHIDREGGYGDGWRLYCHRTTFGTPTGYQWDASHYDDVAVRLDLGGGVVSWYRRLHSSGRRRWHKVVPHLDGSTRDHWLTERQHVFADWVRSAVAKAVPVEDSPFSDQALYDELQERSETERAIIDQHLARKREEADFS